MITQVEKRKIRTPRICMITQVVSKTSPKNNVSQGDLLDVLIFTVLDVLIFTLT